MTSPLLMNAREAFEAWFATASAQKEGLELGWRGIAFAAWTASRKQAMEDAADIADGHASVEGIAQRIAAAIRASASLRKEGKSE